MRNGPVLWNEVLRIARNLGDNPIIAGGAIRDYVILRNTPKDIDVFLEGQPPEIPEIEGLVYQNELLDRFPEYRGRGGIAGIRQYEWDISPCPIQFIWLDGDPVQYVKEFDLGTSQCYYRGAMVLGKNFLDDWHHQQITILPQAFRRPGGIDRSRERAQALSRKYPNGAAIVEIEPPPEEIVQGGMGILPILPMPGDQVWDRNVQQDMVRNFVQRNGNFVEINGQLGGDQQVVDPIPAIDLGVNWHPANNQAQNLPQDVNAAVVGAFDLGARLDRVRFQRNP